MKGNIGSCRFQFNQKTTKMDGALSALCISKWKKAYSVFKYSSDYWHVYMYCRCPSYGRRCTRQNSKKRSPRQKTFLSRTEAKAKGDWVWSLSFPAAKPEEKSGGHYCIVTDTAKGFSAASYVCTVNGSFYSTTLHQNHHSNQAWRAGSPI